MENQIRLQHQRTPSISIIRPKVYPKVDPFVFEPIDDDMARAEQSFKQCRNSKHLEELNRELEEIMGSRLTPDDQRVIAATAERLSLSRAERERSMNKTFVRDDSAEENLHDTFEDKLNFSQEASVVQEQQMTPIRKIAGIAEDLPITKSCCGIFSFKRESKAEYVLRVNWFNFLHFSGLTNFFFSSLYERFILFIWSPHIHAPKRFSNKLSRLHLIWLWLSFWLALVYSWLSCRMVKIIWRREIKQDDNLQCKRHENWFKHLARGRWSLIRNIPRAQSTAKGCLL